MPDLRVAPSTASAAKPIHPRRPRPARRPSAGSTRPLHNAQCLVQQRYLGRSAPFCGPNTAAAPSGAEQRIVHIGRQITWQPRRSTPVRSTVATSSSAARRRVATTRPRCRAPGHPTPGPGRRRRPCWTCRRRRARSCWPRRRPRRAGVRRRRSWTPSAVPDRPQHGPGHGRGGLHDGQVVAQRDGRGHRLNRSDPSRSR